MKRNSIAVKVLLMLSVVLLVVPMSVSAQEKKTEEPRFKIGGFAHFDYYRGSNGTADTVSEQAFTARRVRLSFSARITDQISFTIVPQLDDAGTGERTGTLKDLFVNLKLHEMATVRAGLYKYEFDLQGRGPGTVMPFINRTVVTNAVAGRMTGEGGDFRDKGVSVIGKTGIGSGASLGYGLGVWQGIGPDRSDNNSDLGYTANLWVSPIKGLKLNGGYMTSDNTPKGTALAATPTGTNNKYRAAVVGVQYDEGPIFARAEYYDAELKGSVVRIDRKGWYVEAVYSVLPKLDVMARYQEFENETWGADNNKINSVDLGAKYYFAKKGRRGGTSIAVNYMIRDADSGVSTRIFDERGGTVTGSSIKNVFLVRLQVEL